MLSSHEVLALDAILKHAILKSKEEDDGDPIFHEVDVATVNPFDDKRTLDQVYTSLAQQGMIECSGTLDTSGNEVLESVCITPIGFAALTSAQGMN